MAGASTISGSPNYDNYASSASEVWFRIKRVGSTFSLYSATSRPYVDGDWTSHSPASQWTYSGRVHIWLHGSDPFAGSGTAYFDYIRDWASNPPTSTTSSSTSTTTSTSTSTSTTTSSVSTSTSPLTLYWNPALSCPGLPVAGLKFSLLLWISGSPSKTVQCSGAGGSVLSPVNGS